MEEHNTEKQGQNRNREIGPAICTGYHPIPRLGQGGSWRRRKAGSRSGRCITRLSGYSVRVRPTFGTGWLIVVTSRMFDCGRWSNALNTLFCIKSLRVLCFEFIRIVADLMSRVVLYFEYISAIKDPCQEANPWKQRWVMLAIFASLLGCTHDAQLIWVVTGSMLNAGNSNPLKCLVNHPCPTSALSLKIDPRMSFHMHIPLDISL
eukprot:Gb_32367 [translate_table: standard]